MKSLQEFPRISLAVLPTPIQKLENISRLLGPMCGSSATT